MIRCEAASTSVTDLIRAAAKGDNAAWNQIVEQYLPLVWTVARRCGLSPVDADDVSQTTFLRLFEHVGSLRDPERVGSWLTVTARHESFRVMRLAGRQIPVDEPNRFKAPRPEPEAPDDEGPTDPQLNTADCETTSDPTSGRVKGRARMPLVGRTKGAVIDRILKIAQEEHPDAVPARVVEVAGSGLSLIMVASDSPSHETVETQSSAKASQVNLQLMDSERDAELWRAFAQLSTPCQRLLKMLIAEPPPRYAEVAEALDMPIGSIGPTRRRCLDCLRRHLEGGSGEYSVASEVGPRRADSRLVKAGREADSTDKRMA